MHPSKVQRSRLRSLTDLPNIGPAMAGDLRLLGIAEPQDLRGRDPYQMYDDLCRLTSVRHDPCVIDCFISITRFIDGEEPKLWWDFTEERKAKLRDQV
ncbi:MAG: helix-hairpin-helix domain-containing protein [Pirellulales bacterium]